MKVKKYIINESKSKYLELKQKHEKHDIGKYIQKYVPSLKNIMCTEYKVFGYINQIGCEIRIGLHNNALELFNKLIDNYNPYIPDCLSELNDLVDIDTEEFYKIAVPEIIYAMLYDDCLEYENVLTVDNEDKICIIIDPRHIETVTSVCNFFGYILDSNELYTDNLVQVTYRFLGIPSL